MKQVRWCLVEEISISFITQLRYIFLGQFDIVNAMSFSKVAATIAITLLLILGFSSCSTIRHLENIEAKGQSVSSFLEEAGVPQFQTTVPLFYHTGSDWHDRSFELIQQAQDYIIVSTFLGVEHPSVNPVWEALAQKARQGVNVYVLIDSSSNFQMVPVVNDRIKAAYMYLQHLGLNVVEYNSLSLSNLFFLPNLLDRDHRKYWVIDGTTIALGGVNVNHTSVAWPTGVGNIDTMIEMKSPQTIRYVIDSFVDTWNKYSTYRLESKMFAVAQINLAEEGQTTKMWVLDHKFPQNPLITDLFDLFAISAEQELWMIQGYTFLNPSLLARIRYTVNRGVKVNVILSEFSTQPKYEMASRYGILDLMQAGATVYMYDSPNGAFLHAKMLLADRKLATVGSANYNFRSETLSRELNVLFEDERIGNSIYQYVEDILRHCTIITEQEARNYRNFRYWYNHMLMQVWG